MFDRSLFFAILGALAFCAGLILSVAGRTTTDGAGAEKNSPALLLSVGVASEDTDKAASASIPAAEAEALNSSRPEPIIIPADIDVDSAIDSFNAFEKVQNFQNGTVEGSAAKAESDEGEEFEVLALVTGYCPCARCCGNHANGRTSTGTSAWKRGVASAPNVIPYGSIVSIPGYGTAVVDDTGYAMRASWRKRSRVHFDVRFTYHWQARKWGTKYLMVKVRLPKKTTETKTPEIIAAPVN